MAHVNQPKIKHVSPWAFQPVKVFSVPQIQIIAFCKVLARVDAPKYVAVKTCYKFIVEGEIYHYHFWQWTFDNHEQWIILN